MPVKEGSKSPKIMILFTGKKSFIIPVKKERKATTRIKRESSKIPELPKIFSNSDFIKEDFFSLSKSESPSKLAEEYKRTEPVIKFKRIERK